MTRMKTGRIKRSHFAHVDDEEGYASSDEEFLKLLKTLKKEQEEEQQVTKQTDDCSTLDTTEGQEAQEQQHQQQQQSFSLSLAHMHSPTLYSPHNATLTPAERAAQLAADFNNSLLRSRYARGALYYDPHTRTAQHVDRHVYITTVDKDLITECQQQGPVSRDMPLVLPIELAQQLRCAWCQSLSCNYCL